MPPGINRRSLGPTSGQRRFLLHALRSRRRLRLPDPGQRRIRVGSEVQKAKLVRRVEPVYPPMALQARIQGIVRLDVVIGEDGRVTNATVVSGHPLLVPAATEAIKQWEYSQTVLNGKPAEVITQADVNFVLNE